MDFPKFVKPTPPEGITERDHLAWRGDLRVGFTEYRPEGENLPVAIVSHGFMASRETERHYAIELAKLGYAAFCLDFCGGSAIPNGSDGKTTEMSVLTEVEDLKAVLAYALALEHTSSEHTLLMGCSQGGFVSALAATELGSSIEKIVLFYPALCIPDDARSGQMMFARFDPHDLPETVQCGPMLLGRCYMADVIEMDPNAAIAPFQGRVLIVHGSADDLVKASYSESAAKAYLDSCPAGMSPDERVRLEIIEGAPHGFRDEQDEEAIGYVREFAAL